MKTPKSKKKPKRSVSKAAAEKGAKVGPVAEESAAPDVKTVAEDPQKLLAEARDKILRSKAEFDNYRKRTQREFAEIREHVKLLTVQEFLTVLDHFRMAMDHADQSEDVATLKQGMEMILAEFQRTFENLGVSEVKSAGEIFDPTKHEAIAQEPSEEIPEGNIVRQWKPGFLLGEKLIRPATVIVSAGPPVAEAEDAADEPAE
ncbi:MAG: nucleotide exchange factor GrpE [Lentisphaerae bacterium]|jgi:molecular chaperone GrpE|nr:nucleotide exchange factor GrpE [Lentisphaerota bacterium]MBT4814521.1 nucleotide exchange factor GrpE [Lentisphaerota bacterium]MBT5605195.1 nucleotide exchange factor GrpE [Lentisphaerota bacterium]MBT7054353.1 nucleotide exchange factor GrpE [Lentisphaerota bacterium]MBT7844863.1 nucleotide exchange factor GrpE [Lentisphaerota bacterium]